MRKKARAAASNPPPAPVSTPRPKDGANHARAGRPRLTARAGASLIERFADARGERGRRTLVGQLGAQRRAHGLEILERRAALRAGLEVPLEGGGVERVELAVEISMQAAFGLSARHRVPPRSSSTSGPSRPRGRARAAT